MSGNAFSGAWPRWLFNAILGAPAKVNVNLTVCASFTASVHLPEAGLSRIRGCTVNLTPAASQAYHIPC